MANREAAIAMNSTAVAALVRHWANVIRDLNPSLGLPARVMRKYFEELGELRQPGTNAFLLMANFEVYAACVADLLKYLKDIAPRNGVTIGVTTVFRRPIHRWYNLTRRERAGEAPAAFTTTPWENYKQTGKSLKTRRLDPDHGIHFRRIVEKAMFAQAEHQFVYCERSEAAVLQTGDAHIFLQNKPDCLTVMPEVLETIRHGLGDAVYLIADHASESCSRTEHGTWHQLSWNFNTEYHDRVCEEQNYIEPNEKGVFSCHARIETTSFNYEDLFLVDMTETGGGTFGISFHRDEFDRPGIGFLTDFHVRKMLEETNGLWLAAGGKQ